MTKAQNRKYKDKLKFFLCINGLTIDNIINDNICHNYCQKKMNTRCPRETLFYNMKEKTVMLCTSTSRILNKRKLATVAKDIEDFCYICVDFIRK